jgi:hypothetical protein
MFKAGEKITYNLLLTKAIRKDELKYFVLVIFEILLYSWADLDCDHPSICAFPHSWADRPAPLHPAFG